MKCVAPRHCSDPFDRERESPSSLSSSFEVRGERVGVKFHQVRPWLSPGPLWASRASFVNGKKLVYKRKKLVYKIWSSSK